jgi:hypothetical protein
MSWNQLIVCTWTAATVTFCASLTAQEWDGSEFVEQHAAVCQCPDDVWRTIPWKTDLLEAQRLAVAESKPIFIWAMDGHPLGCT